MKNKLSFLSIPYVVWMALFTVAPIVMVVIYAFTSAAEVGVFAILCREKVAKSLFNGLNDYCLAVEIGFLVDELAEIM